MRQLAHSVDSVSPIKVARVQGVNSTFPDTIDLSESPFSAYAPEPWTFAYAPIEEVRSWYDDIYRASEKSTITNSFLRSTSLSVTGYI